MWRSRNFVILAFLALTYLYLFPGSQYLFENRTDLVMSDGSILSTRAHRNLQILDLFAESPLQFFSGALHLAGTGAPEGESFTLTWPERIAIPLFSSFLVPEQVNSAWSFILVVLSGLAMYGLGRMWGWSVPISFAAGIAWVFTASMRARAAGHSELLATYHLPLIVIGFLMLSKGKGWRSLLCAAAIFLASMWVPPDHVRPLIYGLPLLIVIYLLIETRPTVWVLQRLAIASIPAVLCVLYPGMNSPSASDSLAHFSAQPLDYFTGDTGLGPEDLNPLKERFNYLNFENSNGARLEERTHGVRWLIWICAALALGLSLRKASKLTPARKLQAAFMAFSALGFVLSFGLGEKLGFDVLFLEVPSRVAIWVPFGLIVTCGLALNLWSQALAPTRQWGLWLLPVLVIAEFPPLFQEMSAASVQTRVSDLEGLSRDECGVGLRFPYVSQQIGALDFYQFLEQIRGLNCPAVNSFRPSDRDRKLILRLGITEPVIDQIMTGDSRLKEDLARVTNCMNLGWIAFDSRIGEVWQVDMCNRLQGKLVPPGYCLRPMAGPVVTNFDSCL